MSPDLAPYFQPHNPACFVIAEVAQAHDGSLGQAHAFIDAVALTGANAIKFQTHIASAESSAEEPFRVKFSSQDASRYDYWKRMEFTEEQWLGLACHAQEKGLVFLSSPFSIEAVALLDRVGVPLWKVGSGEVSNLPQLEVMAKTGKPVLLSSGMSSWSDLEKTVTFLRRRNTPLALLQATTSYPTPPEKTGLNLIPEFIKHFSLPVGLSDHSGTIFPSLAAYTLGARFVEVHVAFSRHMFGPDISSSLTIEELTQLVQGLRFLETAFANPVDKDQMAAELADVHRMFSKSVVAALNLPAGKILEPSDLSLRKPGMGIPAAELNTLYGKSVQRNLTAGAFLRVEDLGPGASK
jgi:N-acetylneuraminate synthase